MAHLYVPLKNHVDGDYCAARTELDELLGSEFDLPAGRRVDELIEMVESFEATGRFVPDWSDESFQHAA